MPVLSNPCQWPRGVKITSPWLEGSRPEGDDEYLQLAGAQGEGAYEVRDLNPSDEEVQQWQRELNVYLASEWG